jgi:hypothetical protein
MRRIFAAALALSLLAFAPTAAPQTVPFVHISELLPAPDSASEDPDLTREFIELHNAGDVAVDLAGWVIEDELSPRYTFSAWTIPVGGHVVVWGGGASDSRGPAGLATSVWNNGGDIARLFDASGALVDELRYGSVENATLAAPPVGVSLQLLDGVWREGAPTPGYEPEVQGGDITATVLDIAPRIVDVSAPAEVRRGETFSLAFTIEEDNGDAVTWEVRDGSGGLASGSGVGAHIVSLTAPDTPGSWSLVIAAADANETTADIAIAVRASDLEIVIAGPLDLPAFAPGDRDVTTPAFTIRNVGLDPITPILDLSPLRSATGEVPVDGNVIVTIDDGVTPVTVEYTGPMTPLVPLAGGTEAQVTFTFVQMPVPLPAGAYGTSFTVVSS